MNDLFEKMFPNIKTDHGGVTLGDVLVILISLTMLIFTGFRSWDIIKTTVPQGWEVVAYVGLFALDGGMIIWALVWMFGSTTRYQDWLAMTMWLIDALGVGLAAMADTFLYAPTATNTTGMVEAVSNAVWWVVPLLAMGNALAGIVYHFTHPAVLERRRERRLQAELREQAQTGRYHLRRQELQAEQARDLITQRQQVLDAYAKLVEQKRHQDALERQLIGKLLGNADAAATLDEAVRKALEPAAVEAQTKDGDGIAPIRPAIPVAATGGTNHRGHDDYTPDGASYPPDGAPPESPPNPTR